MAVASRGPCGGILIGVVDDDDDDDDGRIRLMGMRWLASGDSNQRHPPCPPLIRGLKKDLNSSDGAVCMCVYVSWM